MGNLFEELKARPIRGEIVLELHMVSAAVEAKRQCRRAS